MLKIKNIFIYISTKKLHPLGWRGIVDSPLLTFFNTFYLEYSRKGTIFVVREGRYTSKGYLIKYLIKEKEQLQFGNCSFIYIIGVFTLI